MLSKDCPTAWETSSNLEEKADRPVEECGVFGIFQHEKAPELTYFALIALQHRGQEAAGMAVMSVDGMHSHKGLGLVSDVFANGKLLELSGVNAIGHVRYSTAGENTIQNAQPITVATHRHHLAIAHNGNLVNARQLRIGLELEGSLFQSTSDTEVIAHLIARSGEEEMVSAVESALQDISGGFALVMLTDDQLIAARDPFGLRPLVLGELDGSYCLASETCALETIGARYLRDIEPGELITIQSDGIISRRFAEPRQRRMCTFEYIYFARPDSDIDGYNVHAVRKKLGKILAERHPADGDIVIGVPDSSISAASGFAEASKIPFEMGLIKNKYIARTFIQPSQELRDMGVRMKLNAVRGIVDGKRVVLIDDSIVRGTTIRRIVQLLRNAGATEVHLRISSPPYKNPCHYGIDTATRRQLIAATHSVEEICREVGADSLEYMTVEELMEAFQFSGPHEHAPFCNACFTGRYPTDLPDQEKDKAGTGETGSFVATATRPSYIEKGGRGA
ncbi:amidophosphoribosyltransferase [Alicyclobacillus sp. TC]|uniref:Amidophosphoribosyltransferase n=1 Tax=Alicyclobacillus tolerans TaxID=90970 RepID=A0ABT9LZC5_9BACL|nr:MULTISPECIES: amidophosphoribosyltransferase [Alicyclobacillus]MDP9729623.1 amidophosphoribosyltransferase [Alicyclobacillus tengchongensis]QRF22464.1 amidophosphoribosyltransferase [Alicyclobacillus sp. TC]